jgi:uncharacterized protein YggE
MKWRRCLIALSVLACLAPGTTRGDGIEDVATLTVRGHAELHKPSDRMRLQVGVVTENEEAKAALDENSARMAKVVAALTKTGLTEQEYETGRFSIRPVYSHRPRNAPAEWRPQIVGYEVANSLLVRTRKLELAGELIETANRAGANSIDAIVFDLANPRTHRAEAIATATTNARSDAGILARSADLKLVRVISISLDDAGRRPPAPSVARAGLAIAEAAVAPPIRPGEVTVQASVTIVYEIEPAGD